MKKAKRIVLWSSVICIVAFILFVINSWKIELYSNGFRNPVMIYSGLDVNSNEYRVVRDSNEQNSKLGFLGKNSFGMWKLLALEDSISRETGLLYLNWIGTSNVRWFGFEENPCIEFERHAVYCGNNAIRKIDNLAEKLPLNATMGVWQSDSYYVIHLIMFSEESEIPPEKDFYQLLKDEGYVS